MFEKAARLKLRFDTTKGYCSVEDLWDLPLTSTKGTSLDDLAKQYKREINASAEESFVVKSSATNTIAQLKFDLVKHVIDTKMKESEVQKTRVEKQEKRKKILEIIASKEEENLQSKSKEELLALLEGDE